MISLILAALPHPEAYLTAAALPGRTSKSDIYILKRELKRHITYTHGSHMEKYELLMDHGDTDIRTVVGGYNGVDIIYTWGVV